jgi:uncharacterized DUF497 family protein
VGKPVFRERIPPEPRVLPQGAGKEILDFIQGVRTVVHMDIEFDPAKSQSNLKKHGVSFEEAAAVLLDDYALTKEDPDAGGEQRFLTLGMGNQGRVLNVVTTLRGDAVRLISAWKAKQPQRRRYEQQF